MTLVGTRLPDAVMGEPGKGWEAWAGTDRGAGMVVARPGSFMKVRSRLAGKLEPWCWYIVCPNGDVCTIRDNHQVTEHEDGTITVSPSIVAPHGGRWHGFLRHGEWSEV